MNLGIKQIGLLACIVGGLGWVTTLTFERSEQHREYQAHEIDRMEKTLTLLANKRQRMDLMNQRITELQQAILLFENKLPAEREQGRILDEVRRLAETNSIQTRLVQPLNTVRGAYYNERPIELSLTGDFYGFYGFLQQLEQLPRVMRVSRMKLEKNPERDGEMRAELTLNVFFGPAAGQNGQVATLSR